MHILKRVILVIAWTVLLCVVLLVGFVYWASRGFDEGEPAPAPETVQVQAGTSPPSSADGAFSLLTYNIGFGFGTAAFPGDPQSEAEVRTNLNAVAQVLRHLNPDIVLLQEVDFASRRSYAIDEVAYLADAAGYAHRARVTNWRLNYVPFPYWPPSRHFGRMHSGQAILSHFPIATNERLLLSLPKANPWWYNLFYIRRACQIANIQLDRRPLAIMNCHLDAFDEANREEQAGALVRYFHERQWSDWVVAGDMNAIPPEAAEDRPSPEQGRADASFDETVSILRAGLGTAEVPGPELYAVDPSATYTVLTSHLTARKDYFFVSDTLQVLEARVVREAGTASDHLPVYMRVRLGGGMP